MTQCPWSCCLLGPGWSPGLHCGSCTEGKGSVSVSVCLLGEGVRLGGQIWTPLSIRGCCPLPPTAPSMRNTAASLGLSPQPPGSPPSSSAPAHARSSRALARLRLSSLMEQNSVSPALLGGTELVPAATSKDDSAAVTIAAAF